VEAACEAKDGQNHEEEITARYLFLENLHHGFVFGLIHLGKRLLHKRPIFEAAGMQHFRESESRVAKKNLRIFEPLVVIGHREVNSVGDLLNLFKKIAGLIKIAGRIFAQTELRHLMDEFSVKETLFLRLCLGSLCLECRNALLIGDFFVRGVGASGYCKRREEEEHRQRDLNAHEEPPLLRKPERLVCLATALPHAVTIGAIQEDMQGKTDISPVTTCSRDVYFEHPFVENLFFIDNLFRKVSNTSVFYV
jgi:hypothetical protein